MNDGQDLRKYVATGSIAFLNRYLLHGKHCCFLLVCLVYLPGSWPHYKRELQIIMAGIAQRQCLLLLTAAKRVFKI